MNYQTIDPVDNQESGEDLEHVEINDELQYDIDVASEMEEDDDQ